MNITEKDLKRNEVKAKILQQLKDPHSSLNCLLGTSESDTSEGLPRVSYSQTNVEEADIKFSISEFDVTLNLMWDATLPEIKIENGYYHCGTYPKDSGGHNAFFSDGATPFVIDLSNKRDLKYVMIVEEFISPSTFNHNIITFGFRVFNIEHTDYEFYKDMSNGDVADLEFDLRTLTFNQDVKHFIDGWQRHMQRYSEARIIFIPYIHSDRDDYKLSASVRLSDTDTVTQEKVMTSLRYGHRNRLANGGGRFILNFSDKINEVK